MLDELAPIADKLKEERARLNATLDQIGEEQAVQVMVTPEWTIKDQVAHLAGAESGMLGIARRMALGQDPQLRPDYDNDFYNARQVAKRKQASLAQIREELETSRAELMTFMDTLKPEQLTLMGQHPLTGETTLKDLFGIIYRHETAHGKEISDRLKK